MIDKGGLKNFQTQGDRAVQQLIVTTLNKKFADVAIIGEEDGDTGEDIKYEVIDRLDTDVMGKTFPAHLQNVDANRVIT